MKRSTILILVGLLLPQWLFAQVEFVPDAKGQAFFPGDGRAVAVKIHNPTDHIIELNLRTLVYQTATGVIIPLGEPKPWKKLTVLPRQTVLDAAPINFPPVKNETRFVVQWLDENNKSLTKTDVKIYPTNLLQALRPLAGKKPLGIYDPQNELQPLLQNLAIDYENLADTGVMSFSGKLAIIGPLESKSQLREGLFDDIRSAGKSGKAIVWIQPPPEKWAALTPTFYSVPVKDGAVVIVQSEIVANLASNPRAQLNLIYLCQQAVRPEEPALPRQSIDR